VWAASDGERQGSTFTVSLPATTARSSDAALAIPPQVRDLATPMPSLTGLSVLIVEDHEDSRTLLASMLEDGGATVTAVESAAAAFLALRTSPPDVIVSDIGLPGEDGYSLIRTVRSMDVPYRRIPALALTAYARSEDRRLALLAGFQMHMGKPVDVAELCTAVASLAGRL
jgi:CheY-like chemotaxis protein